MEVNLGWYNGLLVHFIGLCEEGLLTSYEKKRDTTTSIGYYGDGEVVECANGREGQHEKDIIKRGRKQNKINVRKEKKWKGN